MVPPVTPRSPVESSFAPFIARSVSVELRRSERNRTADWSFGSGDGIGRTAEWGLASPAIHRVFVETGIGVTCIWYLACGVQVVGPNPPRVLREAVAVEFENQGIEAA